MDTRTAIRPPTRGMDLPNLRFELVVSPPTSAVRAHPPHVIATARHPQDPTEDSDRVLARVGRDELVFVTHCGIREQMPMAFFKISRS